MNLQTQKLSETFDSSLAVNGEDFFKNKISNDLIQNLNPKFELREYQREAIGRFIFYLKDFPKRKNPSQLLFNMATGSGKTLIMASCILELYQQGYRNFIFFVNSTNIIEKTRNNFLSPISSKYLFSEKIKFGDKDVLVREVDNFDTANDYDINIVFTTIQGLHSRLNEPRENALTYEDFEGKRIVLLSDEAHHINTLTKKGSLNKTEEENLNSWENTVNKIFNQNKENILLEFTATIDWANELIYQKYHDKILYQYDLKHFRKDRFSKEIEILQADFEPMERAILALILSQYRRKVAGKNGIQLKPVILMKSKDIKESEEFEKIFHEKLKSLNISELEKIKKIPLETLQKAFEYFEQNEITLEILLQELKEEFSPEKCVSVNSKNDSEQKQILVNSLEDYENQIRVVFAVDKLNEGWDVLNLFDIVRLYDTRDSGKKIGKTTMAEAQLIGRGARYFPFAQNAEQERFKRKFDEDITNDLRIIEQLYYPNNF